MCFSAFSGCLIVFILGYNCVLEITYEDDDDEDDMAVLSCAIIMYRFVTHCPDYHHVPPFACPAHGELFVPRTTTSTYGHCSFVLSGRAVSWNLILPALFHDPAMTL